MLLTNRQRRGSAGVLAAACVWGFAGPVRAEVPQERLTLFVEAAASAAEMDAMDAYCKTPEKGAYAEQIVAGAVRQKASPPQVKQVKEKVAQVKAQSTKRLQAEKPDCKSVEFMFRKYALLDTLDRQIKALVDGWVAPSGPGSPEATPSSRGAGGI